MPIKIKMAKSPHRCAVSWESTLFLKRCWRCLLALLNKSFGSRHFFKTCFLSCVSPFSNTDLLEDPQQTTTTNTNKKKEQKKTPRPINPYQQEASISHFGLPSNKQPPLPIPFSSPITHQTLLLLTKNTPKSKKYQKPSTKTPKVQKTLQIPKLFFHFQAPFSTTNKPSTRHSYL